MLAPERVTSAALPCPSFGYLTGRQDPAYRPYYHAYLLQKGSRLTRQGNRRLPEGAETLKLPPISPIGNEVISSYRGCLLPN